MIIKIGETQSSTVAKFKQFFATAALGAVSLGSSLAWTSPVLPVLEDQNSTLSFHITHEEGSYVGAMLAIGALISALFSGYLVDRFGQKACTIGMVVPVLIFTALVPFSEDVYTLCVARFFSGVSTGGVSVVGPIYISEIADVSLRGTLGSLFELLIYVGVLVTAILGANLFYITMTLIMGGIALFFGICFCFLPESPTYLLSRSKNAKAETALKFYRRDSYDVKPELEEIEEQMMLAKKSKSNLKVLLQSKGTIRGLIASIGLTSFQQFCGIDAITFYTVQIFEIAGTELNAYTCAIIISSVQLLSAVVVVFIIEKLDRRVFLYISSLGMAIFLAILGVYFHLQKLQYDYPGLNAIPLAALICYMFCFALGLGPIPWLINGELFAPEVKGPANGITIATNWSLLFIVTKIFPTMLFDLGPHYTFYIFAVLMIVCAVFIYFCIPETRGKTLAEIQEELNK